MGKDAHATWGEGMHGQGCPCYGEACGAWHNLRRIRAIRGLKAPGPGVRNEESALAGRKWALVTCARIARVFKHSGGAGMRRLWV